MQAWPLERKIMVTQTRIAEWYLRNQGQVYVSFSGGKDSTVLLDIARKMHPEIEAVFSDTGLEYPEIRDFVSKVSGTTWIYPMMFDQSKRKWLRTNFREVIATYGYPIISKEVSQVIYEARGKPDGAQARKLRPDNSKQGSRYDVSKWRWLLESDFKISHKCCHAMKKNPFKLFEREMGKYPIVGTLASESALRRSQWLKSGCNAFDVDRPMSKPMSFWTEQDVLHYIKEYKLPYCSIYGDIAEEWTNYRFKQNKPTGRLLLTGEPRTGCMFCAFGCHNEKGPNKFQRMKMNHPKQHEYCIKPFEDGGLGFGRVLDYIGVPY